MLTLCQVRARSYPSKPSLHSHSTFLPSPPRSPQGAAHRLRQVYAGSLTTNSNELLISLCAGRSFAIALLDRSRRVTINHASVTSTPSGMLHVKTPHSFTFTSATARSPGNPRWPSTAMTRPEIWLVTFS